jgi:hypothetical protein
VIDVYAYVLIGVALALAVWTGIWAGLRRPVNAGQMIGALLLEAALAVQSGIALVRMILGQRLAEPVTFVAYSIGILAPLALGIFLARAERTRWGSLAMCFTAIVVAVMTLRLQQLWRMEVSGV